MRDGDINYSQYTLLELQEGLASIDKLRYPKNYANLCSRYEQLKPATAERAEPQPIDTTNDTVERLFGGRIALGIVFIPIAILLVWLNVPWWGVALTIGISVFTFNMAAHDAAMPGKVVVASFAIATVLSIASWVVAESMHTSFAALVENYSVSKYVRRLPEYALSALTFSVAAGISWVGRRVGSRN